MHQSSSLPHLKQGGGNSHGPSAGKSRGALHTPPSPSRSLASNSSLPNLGSHHATESDGAGGMSAGGMRPRHRLNSSAGLGISHPQSHRRFSAATVGRLSPDPEALRRREELRRRHMEAAEMGRQEVRQDAAECQRLLAVFREEAAASEARGELPPSILEAKQAGANDAAPAVAELRSKFDAFREAAAKTIMEGHDIELDADAQEASSFSGTALDSTEGGALASDTADREISLSPVEEKPESTYTLEDLLDHATHISRHRAQLDVFRIAAQEAAEAEEARLRNEAQRAGANEAAPYIDNVRARLDAFRQAAAADPEGLREAVSAVNATAMSREFSKQNIARQRKIGGGKRHFFSEHGGSTASSAGGRGKAGRAHSTVSSTSVVSHSTQSSAGGARGVRPLGTDGARRGGW